MPLHIIKQDITKLKCDAIVNLANNTLLGGCETGDAKITMGYNLPCKYVIYTLGPIWRGGEFGEKELLESCYKKSLSLAKEKGCETVAFPLISFGEFGYPKDMALTVATTVISNFLMDNEMTVYIAIFDKNDYEISEELYSSVIEYVDDNYVDYNCEKKLYSRVDKSVVKEKSLIFQSLEVDGVIPQLKTCSTLEDMLASIDDNFAVTLLKLIDLKGITDVECYKKANVSKQTWYKIMNEKDYKPSKNTVLCFAIALELTLEETKRLLATVGFTLSKSSKFDIIIEYFIINGEYNIFTINETLFKFDQVCLGV